MMSYYLNLFGDENDRRGKKIDRRKKETPDVRGKRHDANKMVPVQCAAHKCTIWQNLRERKAGQRGLSFVSLHNSIKKNIQAMQMCQCGMH